MGWRTIAATLGLLAAACDSGEGMLEGQDGDYAVVRTFYATDRAPTGAEAPAERFGSSRGTLTYGRADVSIPRDHRMGELEAPSVWRLEFREDPEKHVVLLDVAPREPDEWFEEVRARVDDAANDAAFVFVHGYNVSFEDAARRTGQMAYDLGFAGAPVFYSWPSAAQTVAYAMDGQAIEWSEPNIRRFLEDFLDRSEAQNVFLIAHSMGNRGLTRALAPLLAERPDLRPRIREIILTAPDIDADVFKRDILPPLLEGERPITLYAASDDMALVTSKSLHAYPRAGDSADGIIVAEGMDTIDATGMDTGLLRHSYFAESQSVLSDIFHLIRDGRRAAERDGLTALEGESGGYFGFEGAGE